MARDARPGGYQGAVRLRLRLPLFGLALVGLLVLGFLGLGAPARGGDDDVSG